MQASPIMEAKNMNTRTGESAKADRRVESKTSSPRGKRNDGPEATGLVTAASAPCQKPTQGGA
ncbi:hypothetical protein Asbog_01741 [Asaia bogorensis NBRC 16594]|uniref:Uncharacterized protein n=1 Tax=Asaia bogorensis NBRC 16594 TaxID=1231624 RepID=A0AAN4R4S4_9PROT|nr:hypothetical protein Asbog_01741 [Asaia bogorensis NBRC 16594]GEL52579.1 hypothetical protein ABO01nite_05860 [Asaia bogorensis NBRC 16594]